MENPLKEGMPNTVTLSSGEVVYDLNGEWDAVFDNDYLGGSKSVVKITQEPKYLFIIDIWNDAQTLKYSPLNQIQVCP
jgi:hypothetical protein